MGEKRDVSRESLTSGAGDATIHNEHEGKSMEVRSQLLVDDVPQAGEQPLSRCISH